MPFSIRSANLDKKKSRFPKLGLLWLKIIAIEHNLSTTKKQQQQQPSVIPCKSVKCKISFN